MQVTTFCNISNFPQTHFFERWTAVLVSNRKTNTNKKNLWNQNQVEDISILGFYNRCPDQMSSFTLMDCPPPQVWRFAVTADSSNIKHRRLLFATGFYLTCKQTLLFTGVMCICGYVWGKDNGAVHTLWSLKVNIVNKLWKPTTSKAKIFTYLNCYINIGSDHNI